MAITAISALPMPAADSTPVRDTNTDSQAKDRFAGMLAHAHAHHAAKTEAPKPKDGTSELDGTDAPEDAPETTGASDATTDASAATADAASASPAAPAAPVADIASTNAVINSIGALNPELQTKLSRVIARVRDETGHDVKIAETYRPQSRQDALYAQGRETAGPVVTWTQNSKHTQGRAVDVVLDNGTAAPSAYAALQRIANEEGLRTLGARDPGHLELPTKGATAGTTGDGANDVTSMIPVAPADASGPGQVSIARLAKVAKVVDVKVAQPAPVARVAQVATVANVATVGKAGTAPATTTIAAKSVSATAGAQAVKAAPTTTAAPTTPTTAAKPATVAGVAASQIGQRQSRSSGSDADAQDSGSRGDQRGGYGSLGSTFMLRDQPTAAAAPAVSGTTAAERTAKVMDVVDNAPVRPLSQLTMNVDAGNGATDRIHVAMRGSSLNTTIDVADARTAQVMSSRGEELTRALSRDGIDLESMRVRSVSSTAAPVAAQSSQSSSDSSTNSRFERGNLWQQQDRQRSQDERRQQQQREQREEQQK